jgi:hypothetical protein
MNHISFRSRIEKDVIGGTTSIADLAFLYIFLVAIAFAGPR